MGFVRPACFERVANLLTDPVDSPIAGAGEPR